MEYWEIMIVFASSLINFESSFVYFPYKYFRELLLCGFFFLQVNLLRRPMECIYYLCKKICAGRPGGMGGTQGQASILVYDTRANLFTEIIMDLCETQTRIYTLIQALTVLVLLYVL